jgi:hypothetical protein
MSPFHRTSQLPVPRERGTDTLWGRPAQRSMPARDERADVLPGDREFVAMHAGYRATGGMARGDDLARLMEDRRRGDLASLARLIVTGEIFSFEWHHSFWVPMFQFELRDLTVKPVHQQVLAEFAGVLDGWTLALWFALPNSSLNGHRPVELLDSNLPAVLDAARTDRFIAAG